MSYAGQIIVPWIYRLQSYRICNNHRNMYAKAYFKKIFFLSENYQVAHWDFHYHLSTYHRTKQGLLLSSIPTGKLFALRKVPLFLTYKQLSNIILGFINVFLSVKCFCLVKQYYFLQHSIWRFLKVSVTQIVS